MSLFCVFLEFTVCVFAVFFFFYIFFLGSQRWWAVVFTGSLPLLLHNVMANKNVYCLSSYPVELAQRTWLD